MDNAGNDSGSIKKKYYVKTHGPDPVCKWNDCLTGSNTCRYGCSTCTKNSCKSIGVVGGNLCTKKGGFIDGPNGECTVCTKVKTNCNCSECYYGKNTCVGGRESCWHY